MGFQQQDITKIIDKYYSKINHKHGNIENNGSVTASASFSDDNSPLVIDTNDSNKIKKGDISASKIKDNTAHNSIGSSQGEAQSSINTRINDKISTLTDSLSEKLNKSGGTLTGALSSNSNITTTGTIQGGAFKVNNQSGFLKADGSIDNSTYLTSVSTNNIQNNAVTLDKLGSDVTGKYLEKIPNNPGFVKANGVVKNYLDGGDIQASSIAYSHLSTEVTNQFLDVTGDTMTGLLTCNAGIKSLQSISATSIGLSGNITANGFVTIDGTNHFLKSNGGKQQYIKTKDIETSAVTNEKIADDAVHTSEILNGAVTNDKIANGTIQSGKILSINADKIILDAGDDLQTVADNLVEDINGKPNLGTGHNNAARGDHTHSDYVTNENAQESYASVGHKHYNGWQLVHSMTLTKNVEGANGEIKLKANDDIGLCSLFIKLQLIWNNNTRYDVNSTLPLWENTLYQWIPQKYRPGDEIIPIATDSPYFRYYITNLGSICGLSTNAYTVEPGQNVYGKVMWEYIPVQ